MLKDAGAAADFVQQLPQSDRDFLASSGPPK